MRRHRRSADPDDIPFYSSQPRYAATSPATELELFQITAARTARSIMEELNSGCETQDNDDSVSGGPHPHENIDDVRAVLERGEELNRVAWGSNASNNRKYYIVDDGHKFTVKPSSDAVPLSSLSVKRVKAFVTAWQKENQWSLRQAEVSDRLDRHGEVFDLLSYDRDGILRVYFAEPYDLEEDPASRFNDTEDTDLEFIDDLGVRRTNDLRYLPTSYFIDGEWYDDLSYTFLGKHRPGGFNPSTTSTIPEDPSLTFTSMQGRSLIQHRKRNGLQSDSRGLTLYWPVRDELTWAKRLLANLMRVSSFQAAFGAIRTISDVHSADAVRSYLSNLQGSSTAGTPGNPEKFDFPAPAVVTKPSSVSYEFPETGLGQSNHIEVLVQLLRACASGLRCPEFMLTANVSEGNFASTLVSEGPFHKGMRFEQNLMVNEDLRIMHQALRYAAASGRYDLTAADLDNITIEVTTPRVQTRNRQEDFEINQKLWESSLLSGKEHLSEATGRDYETEQAQITSERANEPEPPKAVAKAQPTMGPDPAGTADPLRERGVLSGDPTDDPTKE